MELHAVYNNQPRNGLTYKQREAHFMVYLKKLAKIASFKILPKMLDRTTNMQMDLRELKLPGY